MTDGGSRASCRSVTWSDDWPNVATQVLSEQVATAMTAEVRTCAPEDSAEDLMRLMTDHRIRHLPVSVDDTLVGIVSIGDVVKWRVTELEDETRQLHDYITTGR